MLPVDQAPEDVYVINYESMTVPTLKHFIEQRGGTVERGWLKTDLIEKARELEEAIRAREIPEEEPVEALVAEGDADARDRDEGALQTQDDLAREHEHNQGHPDENEENSEPEA